MRQSSGWPHIDFDLQQGERIQAATALGLEVSDTDQVGPGTLTSAPASIPGCACSRSAHEDSREPSASPQAKAPDPRSLSPRPPLLPEPSHRPPPSLAGPAPRTRRGRDDSANSPLRSAPPPRPLRVGLCAALPLARRESRPAALFFPPPPRVPERSEGEAVAALRHFGTNPSSPLTNSLSAGAVAPPTSCTRTQLAR